jgi:hypothetical protein
MWRLGPAGPPSLSSSGPTRWGVGGLQAGYGDGDGATAGVGVVERHGDVGAIGADGVQLLSELIARADGAGMPVDVLSVEAG